MQSTAKQSLLKLCDRLIGDGTKFRIGNINNVRAEDAHEWDAACKNLIRMLGRVADPWRQTFTSETYEHGGEAKLGTLRALRNAIDSDLLITTEELIRAELFDDLLEQADYLLEKNFSLAAGVLGRAVLEEHLRNWCDKAGCTPVMPKPGQKATLNDYYTALYKAGVIDKIQMKQLESLAAIGNDAAHNKPGLMREDVERLLRDVRDFLTRHPV